MKPPIKNIFKMKIPVFIGSLLLILFLFGCKEMQPLFESAGQIAQSQMAPSQEKTSQAIKLALDKGVKQAVSQLGRHNAFYQSAFKIPLPNQLQSAGKKARALGLDSYIDSFEESMNRAAEKAVPVAADILQNSIQQMSLQDVVNIMQGRDDAATQFFKRTSRRQIFQRFLPIVREKTAEVGVTRQYKRLSSKINTYGTLFGTSMPNNLDLDNYITNKTINALFIKMAEKEKNIRANPLSETSSLLKQVFGYYK
jgi:hypothetical protein